MIPRHNGDRANLSAGVPFHAPRSPLPSALYVFTCYLSHCYCAVYHSQAEFLEVSPPLSPASSPRTLLRWPNGGGYQGWDNRFVSSSRRPSSYQDVWSPCTLVNPGLTTSRVYTNVGHIFHHSERSSPACFFLVGLGLSFFTYVRHL